MPLEGEYEPSPWDWSREQADEYAESGTGDMKGMPIILLTTVGAKTGKLRKTPLMRVEHGGEYAVVASLGGAPKNPVWRGVRRREGHLVGARRRGLSRLRRVPDEDRPPDSGVRADAGELSRGTIDRCPLN